MLSLPFVLIDYFAALSPICIDLPKFDLSILHHSFPCTWHLDSVFWNKPALAIVSSASRPENCHQVSVLEYVLDFHRIVGKHPEVLVPSSSHIVTAVNDSAAGVYESVILCHEAAELRNVVLVNRGHEGSYDSDLVRIHAIPLMS
jgi:hypothetical protein